MDNKKKHSRIRKAVQIGWGILTNVYIKGFIQGTIYSGALKHVCVPGMNCHSCPGAVGACPIGALQAVLNSRDRKFPFYVLGYLAAIGLFVGRFICGWLCLFGLIQELLYKIPTPKLKIPDKLDEALRYVKYVILAIFVIGLPLFYRTEQGVGIPFFCKYICPVGTLEAGVPLVLLEEGMRYAVGFLFYFKIAILILFIVASIFIYRPFCKYMCPLGAFYSLFQKVSLLKMHYDDSKCVKCGKCAKVCKMNVNPMANPNSAECIRCGDCVHACEENALSFGLKRNTAVRADN